MINHYNNNEVKSVMKNKLTRAAVIRSINCLGIFDGGPRKVERHYKRGRCFGHPCLIAYHTPDHWKLIDPWGDVSFLLDGVRVQIFCRGPMRRPSHIHVMGTIDIAPPARLNASIRVAKQMHTLFRLETVFCAAQHNVTGRIVDGKIQQLR